MKHQKFNKYEKKEIRRENIAQAMSGAGVYIYQNSSSASELSLPRPTKSGVRKVSAGGQFQGDDYYMQFVKTGILRLVEVLQTPEQEKEVQMLEEQKLLLDQPERVTNEGTVENVVAQKPAVRKLNETGKAPQPQQDILLNESPDDDAFVIVAD